MFKQFSEIHLKLGMYIFLFISMEYKLISCRDFFFFFYYIISGNDKHRTKQKTIQDTYINMHLVSRVHSAIIVRGKNV